jgi:PAS domain S-box-containing protein
MPQTVEEAMKNTHRNVDPVAQQMEAVRGHVAALQARADGLPPQQLELLAEAFEELHTTLEELQAVGEELRQQNEQLEAARETVEAERRRYQELFEFAPDGYLVSDVEGTVREANRAAAMLLNLPQKFLVGKPLALFVAEEDQQAFHSRVTQLQWVDRMQEWEVRLQPRGAAPFAAALTVATVRDEEDRLVALRWLLRDISDRKRAEEQVRTLNAELDQRVRERTAQLAAANLLREELGILSDVSQAMVATNSLEQRLREIARALTRVAGTTHCAIFRMAPDGLTPWVCYGATEEQSGRFHCLDLPPEEVKHLIRRLQSRKGAFVARDGAREPFVRCEWLRDQQLRDALWLPFHLERRIIGVALCYCPGEARSFSAQQLRLADAVATQGAIAIRMSQAFEHERNIAITLQRGMRPTEIRRLGHFELDSTYHPALQEAQVGGDFYDVFRLPDDRVALLMADVSGKGLAAAMQTTMVKNMLRVIAFEDPEPATALARLNRVLYHFTEAELFVAAFYGVLAPESGALVYANAGHDCPLLYRAEQRFCTALDTTGIALGMDPESRYFARRLALEQGDVLLLYTDGITEARQGVRFFGRERLEEFLTRFADSRPSRIVRYLYREARTFSDSGLHDDVALLCLKAKV